MFRTATLKSLMAVSAVALVAACAQPQADEGAAMTTVTVDQLNAGVSRSATPRHVSSGSTTPKCGIGTMWSPTLPVACVAKGVPRCRLSWWPKKSKSTQVWVERPSIPPKSEP